jgi:hypothetical protein
MSTSEADGAIPPWHLSGHVIVACNCDYGCPCNFNGLPTTGKCEGSWSWHVEDGHYGDVPLTGLTFTAAVNWPGAIHEGNGEAILAIDEQADARQREALQTLLSGRAGGPWRIIATTMSTVHGPEFVPYQVEVAGYHSSVTAGSVLHVAMRPVTNPVTGAEVHPRAVLPEGFVFKEAELAASADFHVDGPVSFDHTGRYAALGPFDYEGP